jgi:hypothetical protein
MNAERGYRGTIRVLWGANSSVKVVYSDESGTSDNKTKEPITVVVAILLNMDQQWDSVEKAIKKAIVGRQKLLKDGKEIKGARLFNAIERERPLAREARRMLAELLIIIPDHWISVFHGAVSRVGFERLRAHSQPRPPRPRLREWPDLPATAQQLAFASCIERVERFIHASPPDEKVIWIADANLQEARGLIQRAIFHRQIQRVDFGKLFNIPVTSNKPHTPHIVDSVYWGDSEESLALQLADVCSSVIARTLNQQPYGKEFYQIVSRDVVTKAYGVELGPLDPQVEEAAKLLL